MSYLNDKVIIITGSSAGIGEGIALYLAPFNPRLVLTARTMCKLEQVSEKCQQLGLAKEKILTVQCDVSKEDDLRNLVDKTIQQFGSIYALVNNAGAFKISKNIEEADMADYDLIFRTNVRGPFFLSKLCIPHLRQSKGCIVNISSDSAKTGSVGAPAYCMSKAALDMFTHLLAAETGPYGVRVNSVNPGLIRTGVFQAAGIKEEDVDEFQKFYIESTPLGRIGTPLDIAKMVKFLLTDESSFITGETFLVDGGLNNPVYKEPSQN